MNQQQQQHGGAFTGASFSRAFNLAPRTPAAETATPSSGSLAGPASVSLPMQLDGTSTTATAGGMNTSSMATRFPTAATTTFSSASVAGTSASAGVSSALESYPLFHRAGTAAASSSPVASSSRTSVSPGAGAWSPSPSHHPYNHLGHHHHPHHGGYGHPYAHHPHGSSFFPRKQSMLGSELASETSPSTPQPVEQEDTSSFREAEDETRARRRASSTSPSPQSRKEQMIHRSQSAPRHASGRASPTSSAGPSLASHLEGGVRNVPRSSGEGARAVSEDGRGNMAMIDAMDDDVDMVPSGASSAGGLGDRSLMRSQSGGGVSLDGDYGYDDDARMGGSSNASVGGARAGSASAATNRSMSMAPGETDDDQSMRVDLADLADLISPHQQQHHGPGYSAQSLAPGGSSPSGRRARSRSTSTSISYSLRSEAAAAAAAAVSQFNTTPPPQWKRKVFGAMEEDEVEQEMSQDGGELGTPSLMADELPRPQHADFAARRRMSSSASAGLELVPQERSGDNASSSSSNTQSGAQGGVRVVRRPVQRRQNLLPKPKAHLRVMMQIRGEATLSDAEIQSEAVMHRMSRAGTMSPGGAKHTTSPSWPSPSDHAFHDGPGLASPAGGAAGGSGGPARPSSSHGRPGRIGGHPPLHNRFPESVGDEEEDFAPSSSPSSTEDAYINDDAVTAAGSDWGAQSANGYVTEEDDTAAAQIDRDSRRVASMWGIEGMRGSGAGVGSAFRRDERPSPSSERVQKLMDIEVSAHRCLLRERCLIALAGPAIDAKLCVRCGPQDEQAQACVAD